MNAAELLHLYGTGRRDFRGVDLREADLRGAHLVMIDLTDGDLADCDLSRARLFGAKLGGANLIRANLLGSDLRNSHLRWAEMSNAVLMNADLQWADLRHANLYRANLAWAQLQSASLAEANLRCASFRLADLTGAVLGGAELDGADFWEAIIRETDLSGVPAARPVSSPLPDAPIIRTPVQYPRDDPWDETVRRIGVGVFRAGIVALGVSIGIGSAYTFRSDAFEDPRIAIVMRAAHLLAATLYGGLATWGFTRSFATRLERHCLAARKVAKRTATKK